MSCGSSTFFAPWCEHCKVIAPEFNKASIELEGKVNLATVDCTVNQPLCTTYDVTGYPTIKSFGADKTAPEDYEGGRFANSLVSSALDMYEELHMEPKGVIQLTSDKVLQEQCKGVVLCLVAFLPHILDTGAAGREAYLDILRSQAKKHKTQNYGFVWAEAVTQPKLEDALNVGSSGYPALSAINIKKGLSIPFYGGFSQDGVSSFLTDAIAGKESPIKLSSFGLPELDSVEAWDGNDGEVPKEEL